MATPDFPARPVRPAGDEKKTKQKHLGKNYRRVNMTNSTKLTNTMGVHFNVSRHVVVDDLGHILSKTKMN